MKSVFHRKTSLILIGHAWSSQSKIFKNDKKKKMIKTKKTSQKTEDNSEWNTWLMLSKVPFSEFQIFVSLKELLSIQLSDVFFNRLLSPVVTSKEAVSHTLCRSNGMEVYIPIWTLWQTEVSVFQKDLDVSDISCTHAILVSLLEHQKHLTAAS